MGTKKLFILFSILLSMAGTKALAYDISAANANGVTIYYNYINNGTELEVTYREYWQGDYNSDYSGSVVIPEEVTYMNRTKRVTSIDDHAFYDCSRLTSVTIPNSMISIGSYAFDGCSNLTSVRIGNSVTSIGGYAFYGCSKLTSIVIPDSVTSIGEAAFYGCSYLTSVRIGNSVTSIGDGAFRGCCNLTSIVIPDKVTSIGLYAFYGCSRLASVTIGSGVTSIGSGAFYGYDIPEIISKAVTPPTLTGSVFSTNTLYYAALSVPGGSLSNYKAATGWKDFAFIEGAMFYDIAAENAEGVTINYNFINDGTELEVVYGNYSGSVVIPEKVEHEGVEYSVTSIGNYAFNGCSGLTSITIPNSVTSIGDYAIQNCSGLKEIIFEDGDSRLSLNCILFSCPVESIYLGRNIEWKDAHRSIITITNPCSVTIGNNVTYITDWAFLNCSGLTSISIPNSVTSIGILAFYKCSDLTSIELPSSVTSIGYGAFNYCSKLISVTVETSSPLTITEDAFSNRANATLYVPKGSKAAYEAAAYWNEFKEIVEMEEPSSSPAITFADANVKALCVANWDTDGDGELSEEEASTVTDLGEVFKGNAAITSFDELSYFMGLSSLGERVFYNCSNLASVTIPKTVTSIDNYSFYNCYKLTNISVPNSVTSIGSYAFSGCNRLTSITIPSSVTSISEEAFSYCGDLTSIIVDADNKVYDSRENCNAIIHTSSNTLIAGCKNSIIPDGVTSIGERAFIYCSGLTSIMIPNSVTTIGESAFSYCSGLTSISIPNSVTTIANSVFSYCCSLTSIIIPNSITSIGVSAFLSCSGLTSFTIPSSVTSIGDYMFYNCSGLTSIMIPSSVTSIGSGAFSGCSKLISVTVETSSPLTITEDAFSNRANATLYVPKGSKAAYEAAAYWNEFKEIVEMGGDDPDVFTAESIGGVQMTFKITDEANKICQIGTGNGVAINVSTMGEIILPPTANGYTVTSIADNAFANCTSIYCVYIPNTIQSIGENAFNDCTMLSSVKSYIEKPFDIPASAFANISSYASLDALYGTKEKYQTVTGWNVFYSIYAETAIVNGIRYSVNGAVPEDKGEAYTAWVKRAIWNNYEGEVVIPEVLTIGDESFTVVGIDDGAFYNSQITSVTIPSTVRSIDSNAFENCLALNSITSYIMEPQDVSGSFVNIPADATLYVPAGTKSLYENAGGWNQFTTIIEMEAEDPNPDPDPEQIEVTDISQMDNAIYIEATEGLVGTTIDLCVKVKNVLMPVGCSLKLKLPDGLSLKTDEDGDIIYTLNDRARKMNVTSKNWGNGIYDFALTPSTGTATISGQDGIVITFKLQIPDDMVAGAYKVSLTNCLIQSKADGVTRDYELSDVVTTLTVEDYEPGDVNGDGNITPSDAIMILYRYFNVEQAGFNEKAADLNGDGNITPSDAIEALYLYFGSSHSNNAPRHMEPVREPE